MSRVHLATGETVTLALPPPPPGAHPALLALHDAFVADLEEFAAATAAADGASGVGELPAAAMRSAPPSYFAADGHGDDGTDAAPPLVPVGPPVRVVHAAVSFAVLDGVPCPRLEAAIVVPLPPGASDIPGVAQAGAAATSMAAASSAAAAAEGDVMPWRGFPIEVEIVYTDPTLRWQFDDGSTTAGDDAGSSRRPSALPSPHMFPRTRSGATPGVSPAMLPARSPAQPPAFALGGGAVPVSPLESGMGSPVATEAAVGAATATATSGGDGDGGDDDASQVRLRPRVVTDVAHPFVNQAGLLEQSVYALATERPDTFAFTTVVESLRALAALFARPWAPSAAFHAAQLPPDRPLLATWQHHAGGRCRDCRFAAAMPLPWEAFSDLEGHERLAAIVALRDALVAQELREHAAHHSRAVRVQRQRNRGAFGYAPQHTPFLWPDAAGAADAGNVAEGSAPATASAVPTVASGPAVPRVPRFRPWGSADWAWERVLDPAFAALLKDTAALTAPGTADRVRSLAVVEAPGVFSFPCFTRAFCDAFTRELKAYEANPAMPKARPNSMNKHGLILSMMGLQPFATALCRAAFYRLGELLLPVSAGVVAAPAGAPGAKAGGGGGYLDHHHAFVVEYGDGRDVSLDMHVDDSEVTFSVSLCDTCEGSNLVLCGMTNAPDRRRRQLEYRHHVGRMLVHAGLHRHGALPIAAGERYNLIVWTRSSVVRERAAALHEHGDGGCDCCGPPAAAELPPDAVCVSVTHDPDAKRYRPEAARGAAAGYGPGAVEGDDA